MKHLQPRYSVRSILADNNNWEIYKSNHPELDFYNIQEIERMLDCCNPNKGFFYGHCEHCDQPVIMHLKCNGKMCSRCGKYYVDKWVEKAKKKVLKERHRMVTLTVPADLRPILKNRWDLIKVLQDSAKQTLERIASKVLKRKNVKIGVLVGLQTFGQDIKFHPHLHCMVVEKAKYKKAWIDFKYIPKDLLRTEWQKVIINNLLKQDLFLHEKETLYLMFEKYPNGFITDVGRRSMNWFQVIKYLARYMRHPPIADSRIVGYDGKKVVIQCKDKQKRPYNVEFTVDEFITRLLWHIPEKNFKVVRWYGLYSRRNVRLSRKETRQETIWGAIAGKKKRFKCPKCKNPVDLELFLPEKDKGPPVRLLLDRKLTDWTS